MYDTVVSSIDWPLGLDESIFQGGRMTQEKGGEPILRLWFNSDSAYLPRVTYWRKSREAGGRLRIEFSIPKLAGLRPFANPTHSDKEFALDRATKFVHDTFDVLLPNVREWRASRIDYAWNWNVGDKLPLYMSLLQSLHLSGMSKHPFDQHGVVFKAKQKNTRWAKFYDKSREVGDGVGVLRYEVSNYRKVLPYMAKNWFGCEQTVGEMLQPGRALYCMAVMWDRLGLGRAEVYASDEQMLLIRMKRDFGQAAASAYYALKAISSYGADAHKQYGLLSPNTYYTWKRRLQEKQYISDHDVSDLDALHLPTSEVFQRIKNEAKSPQNLALSASSPAIDAPKIFWKNFAPKIGLVAPIPSNYLIRRWYEAA